LSLEAELRSQIVSELKLVDTTPEDIADDDPLFGEGLGLDSLDAVELVVLLKKYHQLEITDMAEARGAFASVSALADYIREKKKQ
jgi:acyl carrier protein